MFGSAKEVNAEMCKSEPKNDFLGTFDNNSSGWAMDAGAWCGSVKRFHEFSIQSVSPI